MKTYFALSDVHGADVTIDNFIEVGFDPHNENHFIVLMGDYFDRRKGNMYQIVELIEHLQTCYPTRSKILIGNHDEMLLDILKQIHNSSSREEVVVNRLDLQLYYSNGGATTLRELVGGVTQMAEYTLAKERRVRRLINLIESFELYFETDSYIFTHAYINDEREVDTWNRNMIYADNNTGKTIVVGHTSFFHLGGEANIYNWKWAESSLKKNNVVLIDNGSGTNIVCFREDIKND